jgi:hypothetical protein
MDGGTERHNQKDGYEAGIACKVLSSAPSSGMGLFSERISRITVTAGRAASSVRTRDSPDIAMVCSRTPRN